MRNGPKPFIIAEMSGNHNQSLERALEIVEAAARTGAHAIKLQTYTADTMTLDLKEGEFFISDEMSPWKGQSLHVDIPWLADALTAKISQIDWQLAAKDVAPFLANIERASLSLWSEKFFLDKVSKLSMKIE